MFSQDYEVKVKDFGVKRAFFRAYSKALFGTQNWLIFFYGMKKVFNPKTGYTIFYQFFKVSVSEDVFSLVLKGACLTNHFVSIRVWE